MEDAVDGERRSDPGAANEVLRGAFEEFGLTGHEARVLVGVLVMGAASAPELARTAGVARANVYRMLEGLSQRGLVLPKPGTRGLWTTPGREEVMRRLWAAEDRRHEAMRATAERGREALSGIGPEAPIVSAPYLRILRGGGQLGVTYRKLVSEARSEVLVLNRGPYGEHWGPYPEILARAGHVKMRALYQASELKGALASFRAGLEAYHAAGVEGRVVDSIPLRLAIIDSRHVLTSLEDPGGHTPGLPTPVHIEHPAFAAVQVLVFEHLWSISRPYPGDERKRRGVAGSPAGVADQAPP